MSEPSFQLSKRGATWWATFPIGKKTVKVECGDGSRGTAEKQAKKEIKRRLQLLNAAKKSWENGRRGRTREQSSGARPAAPAAPPPDELEGDLEDVTPIDRPAPAPAPPPPPRADPPADLPAAAAPDPQRAEQIKAKLLALGDGRPIEPDAVHGPGERADDEEPADEEGTELLADLFASLLIMGHHKLVEKWLARWKPPKRPGEPHEKMADWEQEGLSYGLRKVLGDRTSMSPFTKWLVGTLGATATMVIGAERINVSPAAAPPWAPPAPAAAPPPPPAPAAAAPEDLEDDSPPPTPIRPPPAGQQTNALGKFK